MSNCTSNNDKYHKRPGVEHTYHDYANVSDAEASLLFPSSSLGSVRQHNPLASGTQQQGFAVKLHYMLGEIEACGESGIVSWQPHGRCFVVHDRKAFVEKVLPNYFLQSTFASFQRQLNLYGFRRISSSQDKGGYYHELFLRAKPALASYIQRIKRKGSGPRKPDSPDTEPNFYSMPFLPPHANSIDARRSSGSYFQNQMVNPDINGRKPAGVQMMNLKNMLPGTMGAPPPCPTVPPFMYFQPLQADPKGMNQMERYSTGNAFQPAPMGQPPLSYNVHLDQTWGQPVAGCHYGPAVSSSTCPTENVHTTPTKPRSQSYNAPNRHSDGSTRGAETSSSYERNKPSPSKDGSMENFGYSQEQPMPPFSSSDFPNSSMQHHDGSFFQTQNTNQSSLRQKGEVVQLPQACNTPNDDPLARTNSGSVTPTSWNHAFGEEEDLWTRIS